MNFDLLDKTIRQQMRKRKTPGLAVAILKDTEVVYSKGFGSRDLQHHLPMTADTLMGIGSVTKSFTAFAIMKLEEMKCLSIEDSVSNYLCAEPFLSRPAIKIKHLLSHSSGIPTMDAGNNSFHFAFGDFSRVYPAQGREEFLAHMGDAADFIIYEPGEQFFYNNDGYTCLAYIIEDLSGQTFEAFVRETILMPLEMNRAVFTQEGFDNDSDANVMTGYRPDIQNGKVQIKSSALPIEGTLQAPGGLYASMNEMLKYAECLLNQGAFQGKQLLQPEAVEKLFAPQIVTPYGRGPSPQYCLGWIKNGNTVEMPFEVIEHGGAMLTSCSNFMMIPELKLAIVVAENASTNICAIVSSAVIACVLGEEPNAVIEDLRNLKLLEAIEGTYKSPHDMYQFVVYRDKGVLHVDADIDDGNISFTLVPKDMDKLEFFVYSFRADNKNLVRFLRDKATGQVTFVAYDRYLYRRI